MSEQNKSQKQIDTENFVKDTLNNEEKSVTDVIEDLIEEAEESIDGTGKTEEIKVVEESNKKVKRHINPLLFWAIMAVLGLVFIIIFKTMPMFPFKWFLIALFVVLAIIVGMYFATDKIRKVPQKYVVRGVNIFLSIVFLALSIYMPYLRARLTSTINSGNDEKKKETIIVNLYVMTDDYKNEHTDIFTKGPYKSKEFKEPLDELLTFKDATYISHVGVDEKNQRAAINSLKEIFNTQKINMIDEESIQQAADALYNNEGDVMLLSQTNLSMLTGIEEYETFDKDTRILYSIEIEVDKPAIAGSTELTSEPFAVFFGGNDEYGELKLQGKTDVDMVVVVNPKTYQILLVSFPRDSYVPNPQAGGNADKLTHLGVGGIDNTLECLSDLLDFDINNYVIVKLFFYFILFIT